MGWPECSGPRVPSSSSQGKKCCATRRQPQSGTTSPTTRELTCSSQTELVAGSPPGGVSKDSLRHATLTASQTVPFCIQNPASSSWPQLLIVPALCLTRNGGVLGPPAPPHRPAHGLDSPSARSSACRSSAPPPPPDPHSLNRLIPQLIESIIPFHPISPSPPDPSQFIPRRNSPIAQSIHPFSPSQISTPAPAPRRC